MRQIKVFLRAMGLAALISANAAHGANSSSAGWSITPAEDMCLATQTFEGAGETELGIAIYIDGNAGIIIQNSNWSSKQGQKYDITYQIDETVYQGASSTGISGTGSKPGFIAQFERDFVQSFATGDTLTIKMGDVTVDQLSLHGSGAAVFKVRQCLISVAAAAKRADDERRKLEHINRDPFQSSTVKLSPNQPPVPIGSDGAWASSSDYPSRALQERREGIVHFTLVVGIDGRASKCEIIESSGHADLDAQTCSQFVRRSKFTPATDENGKAKEAEYRQKMRWQIPK